jgi:hypothetical protein
MTFRPAYDIPLAYGGDTVWLRPSLRAATRLEALFGFPALLKNIQQHDTNTIRQIITFAATDQSAAQKALASMAGKPLQGIQQATIGPAFELVTALMTPATTEQNKASTAPTDAKPIKWADLYSDLFKIATGWLGWTPETTWQATLPEIMQAFEGHTDKLKAIHGTGEDEASTGNTPEQRAANEAAGLDPDFDRAGLHALKGKQ